MRFTITILFIAWFISCKDNATNNTSCLDEFNINTCEELNVLKSNYFEKSVLKTHDF